MSQIIVFSVEVPVEHVVEIVHVVIVEVVWIVIIVSIGRGSGLSVNGLGVNMTRDSHGQDFALSFFCVSLYCSLL